MTRNVYRFAFSQHLLQQCGGIPVLLMADFMSKLPSDARFMGNGQDQLNYTCYFIFESSTFPAVPAGSEIPMATINFRKLPSGAEYCEGIEYPQKKSSYSSSSGCQHSWIQYNGLSHTYNVCSFCGAKETP